MTNTRAEIREFLSSRRARVSPEQAGLPAYGGNRRVAGLRREEVAMLSGVSVDYYVRLERGNLAGASESVLDALARTLRLTEAESEYLFNLARAAGPGRIPRQRTSTTVRPAVQQILDAVSDAPAWVRNGRHDILAVNRMGRALYAPVFEDPRRPVNTTRFTYLNPAAREFWRDYDQIANDAAAMLRLEAGRTPHDPELIKLVGELSTQSEVFRQRWASRDVMHHRSGLKRLHHPVVGDLDLNYESMDLPSEPGLVMNVYTAPAGSPTADALKLLASWAATQESAVNDRQPR
ncbi:XRE family transcriptional regulator [Cryobacterium roopkundense]|uniref:Transcriptional regulator with XRE-family HTH domain n=1 Tax=Cryobacterium roopkundense TaxID=1001240 RepID=A0A099JBJ9_9MICO|nr:helix-turn-helix transcriptional regulator [Cryobacterium roopkundense]KGJ74882.1 XRE family transcriptional regulator [Cryobacterium roopkundense]MBB5640614.1 transcriptional regulator with XRE-family HTH domain [Cryobacterium roopkundense]